MTTPSQNSPKTSIASYNGSLIQVIDHDGKKWLTAEEAGLALGYNEANASQGVRNLYNRNRDEFTDADTCQIKLIWQGQQRDVRVFSLSGCNLLSFFSNTARAKQFRAWAKVALAEESANTALLQTQLADTQRLNLQLKDKLMTNHLKYRRVYRYLQRGFSTNEIASCMKITTRMSRLLQAEMRELELLPEQQVFVFAHTGRIARRVNDAEV